MEEKDPLGTSVEPILQSDASVDIPSGGEKLKFQETKDQSQ